jgi:hypothetical protein
VLNRLLPFRPRIVHSTPTFSLYKITPNISGDENNMEWWIPSFDIGVALYNIGKLPGRILDFRIVAKIKTEEVEKTHYFYPKWTVDYPKFQELNTERFEWIAKAVKREWFPILLFADKEVSEHIILESSRWEKPFNGECSFAFEYVSSKKDKWIQLNDYSLLISEDMFNDQSTYSPFDKNIQKFRNSEK